MNAVLRLELVILPEWFINLAHVQPALDEVAHHWNGLPFVRAAAHAAGTVQTVPWAHVTADVLISERPAEAEDRAIPGHHEGDLIIGINRSAIGTVVERTTGFTTLVHLPREDGWREQPIVKNGPALSGYGALSMNRALAAAMSTLPAELKRSLTWDRGKGDVCSRPVRDRHRLDGLLRRPAHALAARHEREHERGCSGSTSRRAPDLSRWTPTTSPPSHTRAEHATPKATRLANPAEARTGSYGC